MTHRAVRPRTRFGARRQAALLLVALSACGGWGETTTGVQSTNPLPVLLDANPTQLVVGSASATVTLSGNGFVPSSQVRWNDADRTTHYRSAQTLTVDLSTADLAGVSVGKLVVVNGAPGGGTSGVVELPVGWPKPTITALSPTTTSVLTDGSLTITITGTGFVPGVTGVFVGSSGTFVTSMTATQIVAEISSFFLGTPGTHAVTVRNPQPGGGTSNAVDLGVTYPLPTITSLSPDSSFTGAAFTVTVNGTGFGSGSRVRWNGEDRPTRLVNDTRLAADIPATDVVSPTAATISVFNPTPGGGTSNTVAFPVVESAPVITSISPGVITAGAGATTVTISGTNFQTGATAQWNGANRSASLVSGTSMTISLTATDVATAQVGTITVTNPGASGKSNGMSAAVVATGASLSIARTVSVTNTDVIFDGVRGVLYASVPSSASQNANLVVRIDPSSGAITGSVAVGSSPATLAITDDGQYLYVALTGAPIVVRVALATFTKDIDIPLPGDGFFGSVYAEDIQPIPGSPRTIAVSTYYTSVSPRNAGTYLFDDATRRAASGQVHTGSNRITRGLTGTRIYGYNNESTEFGFRSVIVAADGLHEETVKAGLVSGFGVDIEYSGGYVYATTGEVVNVIGTSKVGTIPANGVVRPDAANARVHFLNVNTVSTYHYTSFNSLGTFSDPSLGNHDKMIRWGSNGLAVGGGSTIVLLSGTLVAP